MHNRETEKIGMREFREILAGYLEDGRPLAITRRGVSGANYFADSRGATYGPRESA